MCIRDSINAEYMGITSFKKFIKTPHTSTSNKMVEQGTADVNFAGFLQGHNGWVTSIVAGNPPRENEDSPVLISGSRDKTVMIWKLNPDEAEDEPNRLYGTPYRSLTGHNHFVSDISLSADNNYALSSSWDKTLRLWDLRTGVSTRSFVGHTAEALTCSFSLDNRQIISSGADRTIKLWNVNAECKYTSQQNNHTDWVSTLRYSPSSKNAFFATAGWDGRLKIWNTQFQIRNTFKAHDGNINSLCISPFSTYIATGGRDQQLKIWSISDLSDYSRLYETGGIINSIAFNPKMQWIAVGTENGIKIWDLIDTSEKPIADIEGEAFKKAPRGKRAKAPACTSLTWNAVGKKLFAGFSDGLIRVYHVNYQGKQMA
eukprot:TRINITY_DN13_c0_g1_i8.p2 TRINITY_DN13_c0_g1~~TRINITY_DN13_c0_g1_i8.p2  ORF type:complete len:393 (-),score=193.11 TRINITY_DN13_c0_g1_i8:361-1476(-)